MSKLIFEDENGEQHKLSLRSIPSKSIKKNDIIIATYEIGEAARDYSLRALEQLRILLKNVLPEDVKVIIIATRNGKEDITLKILKDKTWEKTINGFLVLNNRSIIIGKRKRRQIKKRFNKTI